MMRLTSITQAGNMGAREEQEPPVWVAPDARRGVDDEAHTGNEPAGDDQERSGLGEDLAVADQATRRWGQSRTRSTGLADRRLEAFAAR